MNKVTLENQTIYGREYNGKMSYSLLISSKGWENGHETEERINKYLPVQFKRGDMPMGERPKVTLNGWLSTYRDKDGQAQLKLIVTEWQPCDEDDFGV